MDGTLSISNSTRAKHEWHLLDHKASQRGLFCRFNAKPSHAIALFRKLFNNKLIKLTFLNSVSVKFVVKPFFTKTRFSFGGIQTVRVNFRVENENHVSLR